MRKQTFTNYVTICNSHIIPELGTLSIQQLKPFMLQKFVNSLCEKGFAASYIKKVIDVLNGSLEKAKKLDMIARNPMELVEKPKISKQEMKVWDVNEVDKFLATAQVDRLYIAFLLAITTGMRQGEIIGLRWKDLDLKIAARVSVRH